MSVMCNMSCLFSKEFFAVKPLKHIGPSDMEELTGADLGKNLTVADFVWPLPPRKIFEI